MKLRMELRRGDDTKVLWLTALAMVIACLYVVHAHYETTLSSVREQTQDYAEKMAADNRIVREAGVLARVQRDALADLSAVSLSGSDSAVMADFVSSLDRSANRFHIRVLSADLTRPSPAPRAAKPTDPALVALPVTMKTNGTFRHIIAFLADISHQRIPIDVAGTDLTIAHAGDSTREPLLTATIDATLYRVRIPPPEVSYVSPAP